MIHRFEASKKSGSQSRTRPRFVTVFSITLVASLTSACSTVYLAQNAIGQMSLLNKREPIADILARPETSAETKHKLKLVEAARNFSVDQLGLKKTKNYTTFVQLEDDYVTTVVSAAPKDRLEHYQWWFPIVGSVPYKGFFKKERALNEARELETENLDVFVRGVSAYSTLGWFNDPVLSSMLRSNSDYELVELIIHELFHTTLFVPGGTEFNERLATFFARKGADLFFRSESAKTLIPPDDAQKLIAEARDDEADSKLVANFMQAELEGLKAWYDENRGATNFLDRRRERLSQIHQRFQNTLARKLKSTSTRAALDAQLHPDKLNNARLMAWTLYQSDFSDFETEWLRQKENPIDFLNWARTLKNQ